MNETVVCAADDVPPFYILSGRDHITRPYDIASLSCFVVAALPYFSLLGLVIQGPPSVLSRIAALLVLAILRRANKFYTTKDLDMIPCPLLLKYSLVRPIYLLI